MQELAIPVNTTTDVPIYEQIYEYIKKEIIAGNLKRDTRLPSTRVLSEYLQISRSTVLMAYDQLYAEGYIESRPCKGYFVLDIDELFAPGERKQLIITPQEKSDIFNGIVFSANGIEPEHFPFNAWRKATRLALTEDNREILNSGDSRGDYELRETLSRYLHESRGVNCTPDRIILGAGNEYLLMLLNQLLDDNITIGLENPAYMQAYRIFQGLKRRTVPVDMDNNGMSIECLSKSGADAAYVTPSHQYPLGIVMGIKRRMELLSWAAEKPNRYIIEDDYDSEFRYKGKPIPALQGIDKDGKVIYIGTFSRALSPAIRISYMVMPQSVYERYQAVGKKYSNTVSRIDQKIVSSFMNEGYYERHLNRMRAHYKNKHDFLLDELKKWGDACEISGENAGLHVLLNVKNGMNATELAKTAMKAGVKVYPLSDNYIGEEKTDTSTVVLGYATISNNEIREGLDRLKKAWSIA